MNAALDILKSLNNPGAGFATGIVAGIALRFLFSFVRAMLQNARAAAAKTPSKVDDAAVQALETAVEDAEKRFPR